MKKIFKKVIGFVSALCLMVGVGSVNVSAYESESNYNAAPELNLSDSEVEEIIKEITQMGIEEGLSQSEIDSLVSVWYKKPMARSANTGLTAKQFFVAASVQANKTIQAISFIDFKYHKSICTISEYDTWISSSICLDNGYSFPEEDEKDITQNIKFHCYGGSFTTTEDTNVFIINLNTSSTGTQAYRDIELTTRLMNAEGFDLYEVNSVNDVTGNNRNVGALGDILNTGVGKGRIDDYDLQELQYYITKQITLDPVKAYAADVSGDKTIDIRDATTLNRYLNGYITEF